MATAAYTSRTMVIVYKSEGQRCLYRILYNLFDKCLTWDKTKRIHPPPTEYKYNSSYSAEILISIDLYKAKFI